MGAAEAARVALVAGAAAAALLAGGSRAAGADGIPLSQLSSACPTATELAALDADFRVTFEGDPTAGTLVCTAAAGSRDLTKLQERAYQALRVVRDIRFERPLPWTSQSLYDWLRGAIDGIRFRNDIEFSFCCEPKRVLNIQTRNLGIIDARVPADRASAWLLHTAVLYAHEARHAEGLPHTCGSSDNTAGELGAWGVQEWLDRAYGEYTGRRLDAPGDDPDAWRAEFLIEGRWTWASRFCSSQAADISVAVQPLGSVQAGSTASATVTVTNAGPASSPETFLYIGPPRGTEVVSATPSSGACTRVGAAVLMCGLGAVGAQASATVEVRLRVGDKPGPLVNGASSFLFAYGHVRDESYNNDRAWLTGQVSPAAAVPPPPPPPTSTSPPPPPPTSTAKAPPAPKCKRGQKPTAKRPCRR